MTLNRVARFWFSHASKIFAGHFPPAVKVVVDRLLVDFRESETFARILIWQFFFIKSPKLIPPTRELAPASATRNRAHNNAQWVTHTRQI